MLVHRSFFRGTLSEMKWNTQTITQPDGSVALFTLPDWRTFAPEELLAELDVLLLEGRTTADNIALLPDPTFAAVVGKEEEVEDRLQKLWGPAVHMSNVLQTDVLREVVKEGTVRLSDYSSDLGMHEGVYRTFLALRDGEAFATRTREEQKIVSDTIAEMERSGVALPSHDKATLKQLNAEISAVEEDFSNHLVDAQETWEKQVEDVSALDGVPAEVLADMQRVAVKKGLSGYLVNLQQPTVMAILQHATDRALRKEVFVAYNARASEFGADPVLDNGPLVRTILALRRREAQLLGFEDFTALSLDDKMAPSTDEVLLFLERIAAKSLPRAREEYAELETFARTTLGIEQLEPWDIAFVSERLRLDRYAISDEELRPYFPEGKVFAGLFSLLERLYGVRIVEDTSAPVWYTGVRFFRVFDRSGALLGGFYADLSARDKKRGGAWMDECVTRRTLAHAVQLPVAYLNCNFTDPGEGEEGYLTHGDVETVFHEAGHVFHHLLGQTNYAGSAMGHVEWDAIECPSQLLEQWCWEQEILQSISAHRETGEPIPDELCARLLAAKHFQSGMASVRQVELALVDLSLYRMLSTDVRTPEELLAEVRSKVRVTPVYPDDRFLNGFQHIFGGGYAAGYYSYKWAEVIAADVFEAFKESGDVCSPEVGQRFFSTVLAQGAARPFMESFVAFRGRTPSEDALLRLTGLL
mgnify:FL=1